MRAKLVRVFETSRQTLGHLFLFSGVNKVWECKTLEPPWVNNQRSISCIPPGSYTVHPHNSSKFRNCFWIKNVPGRSEILIHPGNFHSETNGCILVGKEFYDIDNDGNRDVTHSRNTMNELIKLCPQQFTLKIYT